MKRYIGFGMIAVPFAALLIAAIPTIAHDAITIPAKAWMFGGVVAACGSAWIATARALIK